MPLHIIGTILVEGTDKVPYWNQIKAITPVVLSIASLKYYFAGARNNWERDLHGKVYIITGGTSGLGASCAKELASRGAQLVLLVRNLKDQWVIDYIDDLRESTKNFLIYAEECDLNSLHSIRKFATKWLDTTSIRRIDGIICSAAECLPRGKFRKLSEDGIEKQIAINYLANFHLLNLLSPALRSQPPDRDIRIIMISCLSQVFGKIDLNDILWEKKRYPINKPWKVFGSSKLMLGCFAQELQRRINKYERNDKLPCNVSVNVVNPGMMRSPSTKRFISFGTLIGLLFYILIYPLLWIVLKSTYQGSQSIFFTLMNGELTHSKKFHFIQECSIVNKQKFSRKELNDEELQKKLFDKTKDLIKDIEKKSAIERKKQKILQNKNKPLKEKLKSKSNANNPSVNLGFQRTSKTFLFLIPKNSETL
ncbi:putative oxidoreductase [Ascoidea rubescens DSM 1968]|uniref:NAD(P)-binding protein n=1 Tax=Ascoidea rubescens DSM 1968 TaxID=1344418 RepID=A0A1D2VAR7_9ASCO|nr:NAD(P)-binding protein [Ascoidea rubescens DSM 1968]ODV58752.1 NAD(P)-binding protein [Ascoidea rubescens DSM 1968]